MRKESRINYASDTPMLLPIFIDASIFGAPFVRDIMFHLAEQDLIALHWTFAVENEWMNAAVAFGAPAQLVRQCLNGMREIVPNWQVRDFQKYATLFKSVLPQRRHVAAAAYAISVRGEGASQAIIVTTQMDGLPKLAFRDIRVKPQHIDDFVCDLYQKTPTQFLKIIESCRDRLKILNLSKRDYLQALYGDGCRKFASAAAVYWKVKLQSGQ